MEGRPHRVTYKLFVNSKCSHGLLNLMPGLDIAQPARISQHNMIEGGHKWTELIKKRRTGVHRCAHRRGGPAELAAEGSRRNAGLKATACGRPTDN
jgi:hypothetical protein